MNLGSNAPASITNDANYKPGIGLPFISLAGTKVLYGDSVSNTGMLKICKKIILLRCSHNITA
jgi:hypothetical protein